MTDRAGDDPSAARSGFIGPIVLSTSVPEDHLPHDRRRYDAYLAKPYGIQQLVAVTEALRISLG